MSTETLPRDDTVLGLSTIEGIDLDLEVRCAHRDHAERHADEPAAYLVRATDRACGSVRTIPLCKSGWELAMSKPYLRCGACGSFRPVTEGYRIVEVLR